MPDTANSQRRDAVFNRNAVGMRCTTPNPANCQHLAAVFNRNAVGMRAPCQTRQQPTSGGGV